MVSDKKKLQLTGCGWLGRPHYKNVRKKTGREFAGLASERGAKSITNVSAVLQGVGNVLRLVS